VEHRLDCVVLCDRLAGGDGREAAIGMEWDVKCIWGGHAPGCVAADGLEEAAPKPFDHFSRSGILDLGDGAF
jgi:hypothetical protein